MKKNNGFSLVELLIVVVVIGLLAAIAVPKLLSSRRAANEASAIESVRKVSSAQHTYMSSAGNGSFGSAAQLYARQMIGIRLASAANVNVGPTLPRNTARDGYLFRVQNTPADPSLGVASTFVVSANPATVSGVTQTGAKRFCVTESGVIKSSTQNLNTRYNYAQCGFANPFVP